MRTLSAIVLVAACLSSGIAAAQSVQTTVDDSPNHRVVHRTFRNGAFQRTETDVFGRHGARCHISSVGVRTPYGMRVRSHRRCN